MNRPVVARSRGERGQSTTEFLLMMPLLMATFFFIIEMSLYFTTVHYQSYATYAAARAHSVGEDPAEVADMLLTGKVFKYRGKNYQVELMRGTSTSGNPKTADGVRVKFNDWQPQFPFLGGILPSSGGGLKFTTHTYLGPPECTYEELGQPQFYDNNVGECCWKMNGSRTCI